MAAGAGFLVDTESAITNGFTVVANTFGSGLLATFRPVFITGFTIWITLIAYEVAFGKSEDGLTYVLTKISKIFLIGTFALYGWPELADLLNAVKDGFASGGSIAATLQTNLIDPIAGLWMRLLDWFGAALDSVGWQNFGRLFSTLALFLILFFAFLQLSLAVGVFGVIALSMFLVANSIFVLLLAIGPFFLLCLAFPFTQRFFESYIGNVMTSIFAMGFTVLMVMFVVNLYGLNNIQNIIPSAADEATVGGEIPSLAAFFAAKGAMSLLIIYLYYKVFDLAAALGGGLNMGNNMIGGVRSILRDLQRGSSGTSGRSSGTSGNQISEGNSGGGQNATGGGKTASARASRANSTFTGMALSAGDSAISGTSQGAIAVGKVVARGASAAGRYAYNRYAQLANRRNAG